MAEDLVDHRRIFDGGDDLQGAATVRAVFDVDVEGLGSGGVGLVAALLLCANARPVV